MSKARVKTKIKTPAGLDMDALNEAMGQLTGAVDPEPGVIYNKYTRLLEGMCHLGNVLKKMSKTFVAVNAGSATEPEELDNFVQRLEDSMEGSILDPTRPKEQYESYNTIIGSAVIKDITETYGELQVFRNHLANPEELDPAFILRHPTDNFIIIPKITSLDIKRLLRTIKGGEKFKKFCLQFLAQVYLYTKEIYDIVTSPNVDPDQLATVLIEAITAHESKFPRHKLAFNAIRKNVNLLKNNLNGYYKEFLDRKGDASVFFHNFIIDVSEGSSDMDSKTKLQLKDLLLQLKKAIKQQEVKDPKVRKMMEQMTNKIPFLSKDKEEDSTPGEDENEEEEEEDKDDLDQ